MLNAEWGRRTAEANAVHWWLALLFGFWLVLLMLIATWLLRTTLPAMPTLNITTQEVPSAAGPEFNGTTPTLKSVLTDAQSDGERLTIQLAVLSDDFKRKIEQCLFDPVRPSPALPADRWARKDLSVLQGCWHLGKEAPAVRGDVGNTYREEDCTSKIGRICFDASGNGWREQTTSCPRAGTFLCNAPVVAQFGTDGSFTTSQPDTHCQNGPQTTWRSRTLTCRRISDDHAMCRDSGRPELGLPPQDQEFRRGQ